MATVNINIHEAFDHNSIHKCYDDLRATYLGWLPPIWITASVA